MGAFYPLYIEHIALYCEIVLRNIVEQIQEIYSIGLTLVCLAHHKIVPHSPFVKHFTEYPFLGNPPPPKF